jgi:glycine cleavage system H protein
MEPVLTALQMVGIVLGGLLLRLGLLLLVGALLLIPVLLVLGAAHGYGALRRRIFGVAAAAGGVRFMPRASYAPGHTWARRIDRGRVRVGLDDLAQRLFSAPRAIDLPKPGTPVRVGQGAGMISCGDKRGVIYCPVSGVITAVNDAVIADPGLVNQAPYERGWLFTVAPTESSFERLMHGKRARAWLAAEGARFAQFLERDLGVAAADGGETIAPAPALLSKEQWMALTRNFLLAV